MTDNPDRPESASTPGDGVVYSRHYPSDRYLEALLWNRRYHRTCKTFTGRRTFHVYPTLEALVRLHGAKTVLDFGAGKGQHYGVPFKVKDVDYPSLEESLGVTFHPYDPAWPPYAAWPEGCFDGVLCHDVLQLVPEADLGWIMDELLAKARQFVLLTVTTGQGKKPWGDTADPDSRAPVGEVGDRSVWWWLELLDRAIDRSRPGEYPGVTLRVRGYRRKASNKYGLWRRGPAEADFTFVGEGNLKLEGGRVLATHWPDNPPPRSLSSDGLAPPPPDTTVSGPDCATE